MEKQSYTTENEIEADGFLILTANESKTELNRVWSFVVHLSQQVDKIVIVWAPSLVLALSNLRAKFSTPFEIIDL